MGIRRAQCFRCDTAFGIEEAVAHLLAPLRVPEAADLTPVYELPPMPGVSEMEFLTTETEVEILDLGPEEALEPVAEEVLPELPPSLTLGDLEGAEEEIMEKTMINVPAPLPEEVPESPYANNGGGYASAKDAIAKLMGAPLAPKATRPMGPRGRTMDVEATLSALDDTLGGQHVVEPAAAPHAETQPMPHPFAPPAQLEQTRPMPVHPEFTQTVPEPVPPALPEPHASPLMGSPMASTVKLTLKEIQAAVASAVPPVVATVPTALPPSMSLPRREPVLSAPDQDGGQDPTLLKVQMEQEVFNNVTIEQMAAWIEQERVHEYNMVARQFSEHWIEASKVPSLRPIFEQRRRRQGAGQDEMPIPPSEILPHKKSLFGGLFGRG